MTRWVCKGPKCFTGSIRVPGDKSISHRALILGALAEGQTNISNFLPSDDCLRTLAALKEMGIGIEQRSETEITIAGGELQEPGQPLDMGNSGTAVRLLAGILAGQPFFSILTGDASIRKRPMKRICEPLRKMGTLILSRQGDLAPLGIRGGALKGIEYQSPVASAQVKSCVLLAGLFADGETIVSEPSLSRDHTERMLRSFGADLKREGSTVTIQPFPTLKGRAVEVPGDISSAAFFLIGALITPNSEIRIENVGLNPTRTGLLDALLEMKADISIVDKSDATGEPVGTIIARSSELKGARLGGDMIPRMIDEIPVLALAAAFAEGETVISDAAELRVKESDRITTISAELEKLGAKLIPQEDGMIVTGQGALKPGTVDSHGDHRIAMTGAIASAAIQGEVVIEDIDCVATSFPGFYSLLETCTN